MPETADKKSLVEHVKKYFSEHRMRKAGATAIAAVSLAGVAAPEVSAAASNAEPTPKHLIKPNKLPGHDLSLSSETAKAIVGDTVTIESQAAGNNGYNEGCTGVYLGMLNGKAIIRTAAHCFSELTGDEYGNFAIPGQRALDYSHSSGNTYQIGSPQINDYPTRMADPLGQVEAISIDTKDNDMAVLAVQPSVAQNADGSQLNPFDSMVSWDFSQETNPNFKPTPGQPVAMAGVPQQTGFKLMQGQGTYIKRIKAYNTDGSSRLVDVVGIKSANPDADKCNFGASGSAFAADIKGQRFVSGPLTKRINYKYDPEGLKYWADTSGQIIPLQQRIAIEKANFLDAQKTTGVDLSSFDTICEYSVPGTDTQYLLSAFGHYPLAKGGDPSVGTGVSTPIGPSTKP